MLKQSITKVFLAALMLALLLPGLGLAEATQVPPVIIVTQAPGEQPATAIPDDQLPPEPVNAPEATEAVEEPAPTTLPEGITAVSTQPQAPEGFEFLTAKKASVHKWYTGLKVPGFEHSLYAYTDKDGKTVFRVYGRLNKRQGMYEATLTGMPGPNGEGLTVSVTGEKPIVEKDGNFSKGNSVALDKENLPEGYKTTTKRGVLTFTNLFGQKEYRVLGEVKGVANAYYPAVNAKPRRGSLAIDLEADVARFREEGAKYIRVPRELRDGFATRVFLFTTDGNKVTLWTDKPMLDREALK